MRRPPSLSFFFFNDTAPTEIYTLSLHDALPISCRAAKPFDHQRAVLANQESAVANRLEAFRGIRNCRVDRKSTRLNSSHGYISYAVFCLKKKTDAIGHQRVIRLRRSTAIIAVDD